MTANPDVQVILDHETYMRRALELAKNGSGNVSPNPLVGCVIVHGEKIIGEGCHMKYGGPHAEVNAIDTVADKMLLKDSTLYVNLEPCSHTGKTPPCADLIIRHQIPRVVVANLDTNPLVAGNGIEKLRSAGIHVTTNVLADAGRQLNNRFFTYMEKKRPRIILKWAETADGFIARSNGDSRWISDEYSRQLVHKWRSEEDAVLVASGTALQDNPRLNVRDWTGRDPIRIVIDRHLKLDDGLHLFDGLQPTICYNLSKTASAKNLSFVKVNELAFVQEMFADMYNQKIQSVIVEGGARLLTSLIEARLWDEARVFVSPQIFTEGIRAPQITGILKDTFRLENDLLKLIECDHG